MGFTILSSTATGFDVLPFAAAKLKNVDISYHFATVSLLDKRLFCAVSEHIALPILLLRYVFHGAGSAQRAASRRHPLYSRALAAKIATSWYLRLIPEGLSDFEATNTGSFRQY